jgi:hypothetical protein
MRDIEAQPEPLSGAYKLRILHSAIELIAERIEAKDISSSMADLIRLLELEAELTRSNEPREINVHWIDTPRET